MLTKISLFIVVFLALAAQGFSQSVNWHRVQKPGERIVYLYEEKSRIAAQLNTQATPGEPLIQFYDFTFFTDTWASSTCVTYQYAGVVSNSVLIHVHWWSADTSSTNLYIWSSVKDGETQQLAGDYVSYINSASSLCNSPTTTTSLEERFDIYLPLGWGNQTRMTPSILSLSTPKLWNTAFLSLTYSPSDNLLRADLKY